MAYLWPYSLLALALAVITIRAAIRHAVAVEYAAAAAAAPDVSVSNPAHADSLLSAGTFVEAGYKIVCRIPFEANTDGYPNVHNHGGTFCTPSPNARIIVMEYENET